MFGIQGVLLVTAWRIAVDIIDGRSRPVDSIWSPSVRRQDLSDGGGVHRSSKRSLLVHIALWVMLLGSMALSVFFSFDSLFDKVFSDGNRLRTSQARVHAVVARVLAAQGNIVDRQAATAAAAIFSSKGWHNSLGQLDQLVAAYRKSMADATLQGHPAQSSYARTITENAGKRSEMAARLAALVGALAVSKEEVRKQQSRIAELRTKSRRIDDAIGDQQAELHAKRAELYAEEQGAGKSRRRGRGPRYRELRRELTTMGLTLEAMGNQKAALQKSIGVEEGALKSANDRVAHRCNV